MTFYSFVAGPLLRFSLVFFFIGILARSTLFIYAVLKRRQNGKSQTYSAGAVFSRYLLPLYSLTRRKTVYVLTRYIFHACLIVVPLWFSGHIDLWEDSVLELGWPAIPDALADAMTLLLLLLLCYFLMRKLLDQRLRKRTSLSDYLLILITGVPFLTGYFLTHGTLDGVGFIGDHMMLFHMLSGEVLLITAVILFLRTRLIKSQCTGCGSCEVSCPTGTLQSRDSGGFRIFNYLDFQCIACGSCVNACPEEAAELRHVLDFHKITRPLASEKIGQIPLRICERCGNFYAPEPQIEKILYKAPKDYGPLCPRCRMTRYKERLDPMSPRSSYLRRRRQTRREEG